MDKSKYYVYLIVIAITT